jgi:glutamate/aspartate transport system substrate-binding protein
MLKNRFLALSLVALSLLTPSASLAQDTTPTLDRIAQTGKIRIGYGTDAPFSYPGPDGKIIGYSIDLCRGVVERLKHRLGLPAIEIEFVARTPSNRIQLLNEGKIDLECNSSTNTEERRKSAAFSYSYFYATTRYVSLAKSKLVTVDDLKGRSVSVVLGTVNIGPVVEINRKRRLNISVVPAETLQDAFDMVTDGHVSGFAMDEVLLKMMIERSPRPQEYSLSTEVVSEPQPYGLMMRLKDEAFVTAVNDALREIYKSPEINEIYARWFENPAPGTGVNLGLPMSESLKASFANPVAP